MASGGAVTTGAAVVLAMMAVVLAESKVNPSPGYQVRSMTLTLPT